MRSHHSHRIRPNNSNYVGEASGRSAKTPRSYECATKVHQKRRTWQKPPQPKLLPRYNSSKAHRSQKISRAPIPLPEVSSVCGVHYAIMRVWESFCHIPRHALYTKQPTRSQATRSIPYLWKRSEGLRRPRPTWKQREHGSTERMSILKASMC